MHWPWGLVQNSRSRFYSLVVACILVASSLIALADGRSPDDRREHGSWYDILLASSSLSTSPILLSFALTDCARE